MTAEQICVDPSSQEHDIPSLDELELQMFADSHRMRRSRAKPTTLPKFDENELSRRFKDMPIEDVPTVWQDALVGRASILNPHTR